MPPPVSLQQSVSHGIYTKDKDRKRVPIKPPSTDSHLELDNNHGVWFEKKVGDMVFVCAKNKMGSFVEIRMRIKGEDGKVKMSLKIKKKDG